MCFRFLQVAWNFLQTGELPKHDPGHVEGIDPEAGRDGAMSALIIFALLFALLLTGMPVSIALGLTVLTFLFTMTTVPLDAVALKLFTGIESFEMMCVPFFILAGNFLTHGGVAKRMIRFATAMVGHWPGGLGIAAVVACAIFAAVSGSSPATVVAVGSILIPAMTAQGFPLKFGAGVVASSGALGILIPPSIVMVLYSLGTSGMHVHGPRGREGLGRLRRRALHGRRHPRHRARDPARPHHLLSRLEIRISPQRPGQLGRARPRLRRQLLGPGADRHHHGRHLRRPLHADRGRGHERGLCLRRRRLRLQGPEARRRAARAARLRRHERDDALHHHQRHPVLVPARRTSRSRRPSPTGSSPRASAGSRSWSSSICCCSLAGCVMEPASVTLILAPILFPVAAKLGIDPVHFGIIMVVNMEIGMLTPPVGLNLYVASGSTSSASPRCRKRSCPGWRRCWRS